MTKTDLLESQLRNCYANIVYNHKIQEKAADRCRHTLTKLQVTEIALSAATTVGLVTVLLGTGKIGTAISLLLSGILLAITLVTKEFDLGDKASKHADSAARLLSLREAYFSLLCDIRSGLITAEKARKLRDQLSERSSQIFTSAPRTDSKDYKTACEALQKNEEYSFSNEEINKFLPKELHKKPESETQKESKPQREECTT